MAWPGAGLGDLSQAVWAASSVARLSQSSPVVFVCPIGTVWCGVGFGSVGFRERDEDLRTNPVCGGTHPHFANTIIW